MNFIMISRCFFARKEAVFQHEHTSDEKKTTAIVKNGHEVGSPLVTIVFIILVVVIVCV